MSVPAAVSQAAVDLPSVVSSTLNELLRKSENLEKKLMLKEVAERAHRHLTAYTSNTSTASMPFPASHVLHALLLGLSTKKPRLCETCLKCLESMFVAHAVPQLETFDSIISGPLPLSGKPILLAVVERLAETVIVNDARVRQLSLDCVQRCAESEHLPVHGPVLLKLFQCSFNLALTTSNTYLRQQAEQVTDDLVGGRVLRLFVVAGAAGGQCPPSFATSTELDWENDDEPTHYVDVRIGQRTEAQSDPPVGAASAAAGASMGGYAASLEVCTKDISQLLRTLCALATRPVPPGVISSQQVEVRTRDYALNLLKIFLSKFPRKLVWQSRQHYQAVSFIISQTGSRLWDVLGQNVASVAPASFFLSAMDILTEICRKWHYFLQREIYAFFTTVLFPTARHRNSTFQQKVCILNLIKGIVKEPDVTIEYFINYDCNVDFADVRRLDGLLEAMTTFVVELMYIRFDWVDESSSGQGGSNKGDGSGSGGGASERRSPLIDAARKLTVDQQSVLREECLAVMHTFAAGQFRWISEQPLIDDAATGTLSDADSCMSEDDDVLSTGGPDDGGAAAEQIQVWCIEARKLAEEGPPLAETAAVVPPPAAASVESTTPIAAQLQEGREAPITPEPAHAPQSSMSEGHQSTASAPQSSFAITESFYTSTKDLSRKSRLRRVPSLMADLFSGEDFHWWHIHQLYANKKIVGEGVSRFNTNWKHGRSYLMDRGVIDGSPQRLARWIRATPSVDKEMICRIFEKVLRDPECEQILQAYLATFSYKDVPVDIALRDTTVEFMNLEGGRVSFESQVWDRISADLGAEYAKQNNYSISASDADTLAGSIIFLHTALHHQNAAMGHMTEPAFVQLAAECVGGRISDGELTAIYRRVNERRWGTPSSSAGSGAGGDGTSSGAEPTGAQESSTSHSAAAGLDSPRSRPHQNEVFDGDLMASYSNNIGNLSAEQACQLQYIQLLKKRLKTFEHYVKDIYAMKVKLRPYCPPVYAQHAKLILLRFYPHWAAAAYLALRQPYQSEPALRMIEELYQSAFDIAAAFGINLTEQYALCEKMIQRCLRQPGATVLSDGPSTTLGLFLLRKV